MLDIREPMELSTSGEALIKSWEGLEDGDPSTVLLDAYLDSAGLPTIGWGHLIQRGEDFSGGITKEEAERLFEEDLVPAEGAVNRLISFQLNQGQFDALCSFAYNVGVHALANSTLRKILNKGKVFDVPRELCRWNIAGGTKSKGLTRRRVDEARMFLSL